jgi:hypothetical protein
VIAPDLSVAAGIDQIDVEEAVTGEVGIEGEAEQTALSVAQISRETLRNGVARTCPVARSRTLISPVFSTMKRRLGSRATRPREVAG